MVKTAEENFTISNYPLEQTEFFYEQKQGMASFTWVSKHAFFVYLAFKGRDKLGDNPKNKEFDYSNFHYRDGIWRIMHLIIIY